MMTEEIKKTIKKSPDYDFLRKAQQKREFILLCVSGSHGYGTNVEGSDIDVRGIFAHSDTELLMENGIDSIDDAKTDTMLWSLPRALKLMASCNPNVIEVLGLKEESYLIDSDLQRELIANADMFLSVRAFYAFGGYAKRKLDELKALGEALGRFDLSDLDKRNRYAVEHDKLGKHAMHLIRLYYTGIDILREKRIITYREKEHDLLMSIRNKEWGFDSNGFPNGELFLLKDKLEEELQEAKARTLLPLEPDFKRINEFLMKANCFALYPSRFIY